MGKTSCAQLGRLGCRPARSGRSHPDVWRRLAERLEENATTREPAWDADERAGAHVSRVITDKRLQLTLPREASSWVDDTSLFSRGPD